RPHGPLVGTFHDQAAEHAGGLLAREDAGDVEMDGTPIPALADNAGPFEARAILAADAGEQDREFAAHAGAVFLLKAAFAHYRLGVKLGFGQLAAIMGEIVH